MCLVAFTDDEIEEMKKAAGKKANQVCKILTPVTVFYSRIKYQYKSMCV